MRIIDRCPSEGIKWPSRSWDESSMLGGNTVCLDQGKKGERESWGGGQETSFTGKQDQEAQPKPNAEYDLVCVCVCMCMSRERGLISVTYLSTPQLSERDGKSVCVCVCIYTYIHAIILYIINFLPYDPVIPLQNIHLEKMKIII